MWVRRLADCGPRLCLCSDSTGLTGRTLPRDATVLSVIFALAAFAYRCYRGSAVMTSEIGTVCGDLGQVLPFSQPRNSTRDTFIPIGKAA